MSHGKGFCELLSTFSLVAFTTMPRACGHRLGIQQVEGCVTKTSGGQRPLTIPLSEFDGRANRFFSQICMNVPANITETAYAKSFGVEKMVCSDDYSQNVPEVIQDGTRVFKPYGTRFHPNPP